MDGVGYQCIERDNGCHLDCKTCLETIESVAYELAHLLKYVKQQPEQILFYFDENETARKELELIAILQKIQDHQNLLGGAN